MGRIGILGGCFNPIHIGHLLMARSALEEGRLDRVVLMPANLPPHKALTGLAPAPDRLAMVRLAIAGDPDLEVSTDEIDRGGVSYAVDTLRALRDRAPLDQLVFILGMDSLRELHLWREVVTLLSLAEILTIERPGYDRPPQTEDLRLPAPWPERLLAAVVPGRRCDISSSEIRRRVAQGRTIRYLVPESVEAHIRARGLYLA
ncbi:MAG: nicotinate-nucleotide adenylyltransferase [Kiritimatiellae bacterium]|nr:nicotinate-nucleotide adenylyltransferase [Kiritimatiellia bacterium]